jgi:hypothetical protein
MRDEVACKFPPPSGGQTGHAKPGTSATSTTRRCRRPTGPTGRRQNGKATGAGRHPPRRENEVPAMTTITKLTKKIERMSALKGWRMRWYMQ